MAARAIAALAARRVGGLAASQSAASETSRHARSLATPAAVPQKVNLAAAFAKISEPWSPHVAGDAFSVSRTINGSKLEDALRAFCEVVWILTRDANGRLVPRLVEILETPQHTCRW